MALTAFSESLRCEVSQQKVHIGILYVGFTENDSGKKAYTADGQLMELPSRTNQDTQPGVARAVMKCLAKRKNTLVLTRLGKLAKVMYQLLPGLSNKVLSRYANKYKEI